MRRRGRKKHFKNGKRRNFGIQYSKDIKLKGTADEAAVRVFSVLCGDWYADWPVYHQRGDSDHCNFASAAVGI